MREGNKRIIIESFVSHLPRVCLIKIESEALVSTSDFRPVLTKSIVSWKRSIQCPSLGMINLLVFFSGHCIVWYCFIKQLIRNYNQ